MFGDILAIGNQEVFFAAILFILVFCGLFWKLSQITLLSAHDELAFVCGIPVRFMNYLFIIVLTVAVALTIRLLGIVLVTALIVVPPAAARNLSRSLRQQIIYSVALGLIGSISGILAAYQLDVPCGPSIVLTSITLFGITLLAGKVLQVPRTARSNEAAPV